MKYDKLILTLLVFANIAILTVFLWPNKIVSKDLQVRFDAHAGNIVSMEGEAIEIKNISGLDDVYLCDGNEVCYALPFSETNWDQIKRQDIQYRYSFSPSENKVRVFVDHWYQVSEDNQTAPYSRDWTVKVYTK